ncbi:sugar ABC transporter permease, partial [Sinorhizobium meliloti]|nr:sugar ABC transporter permease [Sinorhizobium meliloti]
MGDVMSLPNRKREARRRGASPASANGQSTRLSDMIAAWTLAGPALFLLIVLFFLPVLAVFVIALTDWQFG